MNDYFFTQAFHETGMDYTAGEFIIHKYYLLQQLKLLFVLLIF